MIAPITFSSTTIFPRVARARQPGVRSLSVKAATATSSSFFSTLPVKKKNRSQHASIESSATHRDGGKPLVQLTMSPVARTFGTSSMEDPSQYHPGWAKAIRQSATASITPRSSNSAALGAASTMDTEFDPILNLRSMNPLIFESNYDLEDYGPSFRENVTGRENAVIQEWRIRQEGSM